MTKSIIPSRYHSAVIAHIKINGAADAIVFYKKAFGATELFRIEKPDKTILRMIGAAGYGNK